MSLIRGLYEYLQIQSGTITFRLQVCGQFQDCAVESRPQRAWSLGKLPEVLEHILATVVEIILLMSVLSMSTPPRLPPAGY